MFNWHCNVNHWILYCYGKMYAWRNVKADDKMYGIMVKCTILILVYLMHSKMYKTGKI